MSDAWYIYKGGQVKGPYDAAELRRMAAARQLLPSDLICRGSEGQWERADRVRLNLDAAAAVAPAPAPRPAAVAPRQVAVVEHRRTRWLTMAVVATPAAALLLCFVLIFRPSRPHAPIDPALATVAFASANQAPKPEPVFETKITPLLNKYCIDCHGGKKTKAGLNLTKFKTEQDVIEGRKVWKTVFEMISKREMPPDDADLQPTEDERLVLRDFVEAAMKKVDCDGPINPGRVTYRRLNRAEYNNTIRDLFGIDFRPADDFPSDDVGYGFDNIGDVLSMPPLLLEKYLAAAQQITEQAIVPAEKLQPTVRVYDGSRMRIEGSGGAHNNGVRFHSRGEARFRHEAAEPGEYEVRILAWGDQAGDEPAKMALKLGDDTVHVFDVEVRESEAKVFTHKLQLSADRHRLSVGFINDYYNPNHPDEYKRDRNLAVERVEVVGPLGDGSDRAPESHRRIMIARPGGELSSHDAARLILQRFTERAWRRPVTDEEIDRLVRFVDIAEQHKEGFEQGIQLAIQAALVSPNFLFRIEPDRQPDDPKDPFRSYTLNDYELATRLSYFLWSSMPDEELFEQARQGTLRSNLAQQVQRMVADDKSKALVENFAGQWLQLRNLALMDPDPQRFPDFDADLRAAMLTETRMLFEHVLRSDVPVVRFLDADFTWVNERLAKHYGIEGVAGEQFQKVSLEGRNRRGVLTHGSILTLTSETTRTAPVKRGKWILEQVLGTPPPPPPDNVPPLPESDEELTGTLRERLEQHRADPTCASCHKRMDPLGLAFENFDAIGRYRTHEGAHPIDASGELADGTTFSGPMDLISRLADRQDLFVRNLSEMMLTYALGRGLEYYDQCAVDKIVARTMRSGGTLRAMIETIVTSDPFQKRSGPEEQPHE